MTWTARPILAAGQYPNGANMEAILDEVSFRADIIARGLRTTSSSTTTTETGVMRLPGVSVFAGRAYEIWTGTLFGASSVANDDVNAVIRYTTDGSTPTTSSTLLQLARVRVPSTSLGYAMNVVATYIPAADQTLSVLLSVSRAAGTGNVFLSGAATAPIELVIEAKGGDPGDTGVDL